MLMEETQSDWYILYYINDIVSDILKEISPIIQRKLINTMKSKGGRPALLDTSAIISMGLFRFAVGIKDVKHYHRFLMCHFNKELGRIPNYPNFNRQLNMSLPWILLVIKLLLHHNKTIGDQLHFIDSTPLVACNNKRIFDHKVLDGIAARGKSSMGWFFGLKLRAVCNSTGRVIALCLTAGNTNDRIPVERLLKDITGIVVADAGYVSKELMRRLAEQGILFITDVRKNMKRLMSKTEHALLKLRQRAECVFSNIKYRLKAESSVARSPIGYFSRCFYACLAYIIKDFLLPEQDLLST